MNRACPNYKHPDWIELVNKIGVREAYREYITNGETIPNPNSYQDTFKGVNYTLKVINALEKIPRNEYPSNQVQGFYNDLIKYGTPKDQIELLKQFIQEKGITKISKLDLITDLLANFTYTIELNTAQKLGDSSGKYAQPNYQLPNGDEYATFGDNDYVFYPQGNRKDERKITKEEYEKFRPNGFHPTQHYSNMTVPGGTNYVEVEFAIPNIIPSIKGHAQFSTPNGIGWVRSDDQNPFTGFKEDLIKKGIIKEVPCS